MQDPMRLPKPPDYGYAGDLPVRRTQLDQPPTPRVQDPAQAFPQAEMQVPDVVKVRYGAGDKAIVGSLLKAVKGEESGLVGVSSTYAATLLNQWGYPTEMNAWSKQQWADAVGANAAMVNPMATILGGY